MNKEKLDAIITRLQARADNAYGDMIGAARRDECLGWEIKVDNKKFGEAELSAHRKVAEHLGRHRGLSEAVSVLLEFLKEES